VNEKAKTPETDAMTPDERTIERLVRERDEARVEVSRLLALCTNVHDRLLRGDDDTVLLAMLEKAWKARAVGKGEG
jgi:hypothetical protein